MKKAPGVHIEGMEHDGDPLPQTSGVDSYSAVMKDPDVDQFFVANVQIDISLFATAASHS
jgi:hypothetical protein